MMAKINQVVSKTYARNNFPSLYDQAEKGRIFAIAERGKTAVALVPLQLLFDQRSVQKTPPISQTAAAGLFKGRPEMRDAVAFVRKLRRRDLVKIYGRRSGRRSPH